MARKLKSGALPIALALSAIAIGALLTFQSYRVAAAIEPVRSPQQGISVRWTLAPNHANRAFVEVTGLSESMIDRLIKVKMSQFAWRLLLPVYAEPQGLASSQNLPPMLGTYSIRENALRFEPQFPLDYHISYRAVFHPGQLPGVSASKQKPVEAVFTLPPRKTTPATEVSRIYPSADLLPENLLKFYVHFSAPMSRGRIYDHIHLRDDKGKEIELPFLEIDEELWNPDMTRLTLFIDPGRIKRGVLPLEEIGPALEEGKSYALVIDREWRDGEGNPLKETFQKVFKVGPPDRDPPDHTLWKFEPPKSGSRLPLAVAFPEPMDHALSQRLIYVTDESGNFVEGQTSMEDDERRWTFAPRNPWQRGIYLLVVQTTIEDLAGNNIGKPFEVDLFESIERRRTTSTVKRSFEIR